LDFAAGKNVDRARQPPKDGQAAAQHDRLKKQSRFAIYLPTDQFEPKMPARRSFTFVDGCDVCFKVAR
jgi:hypothetical protein